MRGYEEAGVGDQGNALASVIRLLGPTLSIPEGIEVLTRFGHYASVLKVADDLGIAISTDGVGSKTIIASALNRYDTIGFDCVAMNVNDVLCIGARPIAMVDYLGVHSLDVRRAEEVLQGLGAAAKEAGIAIPGGELAQLPEVIGREGDETAFDLVGTCIGTVHPDRLITGAAIEPGDAIVGIASSGIHSNGLTLARRVLLDRGRFSLSEPVEGLGRTLGEELLQPTEIYVRAVTALRAANIEMRGLAHITGDGFANLCRLDAATGYAIETLPEPPAIFELVRATGGIDDAEMYRVFNMGVGFVVVLAADSAEAAVRCIVDAGYRAGRIGTVTGESGVVRIEPAGLVGELSGGDGSFRPA